MKKTEPYLHHCGSPQVLKGVSRGSCNHSLFSLILSNKYFLLRLLDYLYQTPVYKALWKNKNKLRKQLIKPIKWLSLWTMTLGSGSQHVSLTCKIYSQTQLLTLFGHKIHCTSTLPKRHISKGESENDAIREITLRLFKIYFLIICKLFESFSTSTVFGNKYWWHVSLLPHITE